MIAKTYLKKLASLGYSIIPVDDKKRPIGAWKSYQQQGRNPDQVEQLDAPLYGLVTGVNDVECIDVDLKVIVGLQEQKDWWNDYLAFLNDNIEDFMTKVVIVKTKNAGYHILYRCFDVAGNTKIATLQGQKEAIIESRGVGGMVVIYENYITKRRYHELSYITPEEREILWSISRTYHYTGDMPTEEPKSGSNQSEGISPWKDYNDKHTALDVVSDEFDIVRNTSSSYIIRRHGASSPHSGYVYKDSGCMYLFSTGTSYPAEELLSPFACYAHKNYLGDMQAAANDLYERGYGSRRMPKIEIKVPAIQPEPKITREQFPIDIFPNEIKGYIIESSNTLGMSIDYMGSAFMWMLSVVIGNSMRIEVKPGWQEVASLWIAVVGKPGIGKTPSINQMIFPLRELNVREQKEYQRQYALYKEYESMDKKSKELAMEVERPVNKQFIVGDITLEALVDLHEQNLNSIGIFKDELAGWFKDMNKYRQGSDLEFWLSSWSGTSISLNRKTSKSAFVDKPMIPVLGGIQPSVFDEFTTGENKENGFVDRILISYPELSVNKYNTNSMDLQLIEWYRSFVCSFREAIHKLFVRYDEKQEIIPTIVRFGDDANMEWIRVHDRITDMQNSDEENEYMKSMLPKQKSYIPRFALLLNCLWSYFDDSYQSGWIQYESIMRAEKLSMYYINMSKLVKQDVQEKNELWTQAKNGGMDKFSQFKAMFKANPELNRTVASELLGVSRRTIQNYVNEINKQDEKRIQSKT